MQPEELLFLKYIDYVMVIFLIGCLIEIWKQFWF